MSTTGYLRSSFVYLFFSSLNFFRFVSFLPLLPSRIQFIFLSIEMLRLYDGEWRKREKRKEENERYTDSSVRHITQDHIDRVFYIISVAPEAQIRTYVSLHAKPNGLDAILDQCVHCACVWERCMCGHWVHVIASLKGNYVCIGRMSNRIVFGWTEKW